MSSKKSRAPAVSDALGLSASWRAWLEENVMLGASPADLVRILVKQGVPAAVAEREFHTMAESPHVKAAGRLRRQVRQHDLLARLHRDLTLAAGDDLERRSGLGPDEFFARYWATSTPVILTDLQRKWRARTWTPARLRKRFGHLEVEVAAGRDADPDYERRVFHHARKVRFASFVDHVTAGASNDAYMVANNHNLDGPLRPLLADASPLPAILEPRPVAGRSFFWFGPAGTVTPLHHDTANVLLCQVLGRKVVKLIAPWETALFAGANAVFHPLDPENARAVDAAGVRVRTATLAPGEALFIPVGHWHHVRALDVSASVSFTSFARPNEFDWFKPGDAPM